MQNRFLALGDKMKCILTLIVFVCAFALCVARREFSNVKLCNEHGPAETCQSLGIEQKLTHVGVMISTSMFDGIYIANSLRRLFTEAAPLQMYPPDYAVCTVTLFATSQSERVLALTARHCVESKARISTRRLFVACCSSSQTRMQGYFKVEKVVYNHKSALEQSDDQFSRAYEAATDVAILVLGQLRPTTAAPPNRSTNEMIRQLQSAAPEIDMKQKTSSPGELQQTVRWRGRYLGSGWGNVHVEVETEHYPRVFYGAPPGSRNRDPLRCQFQRVIFVDPGIGALITVEAEEAQQTKTPASCGRGDSGGPLALADEPRKIVGIASRLLPNWGHGKHRPVTQYVGLYNPHPCIMEMMCKLFMDVLWHRHRYANPHEGWAWVHEHPPAGGMSLYLMCEQYFTPGSGAITRDQVPGGCHFNDIDD